MKPGPRILVAVTSLIAIAAPGFAQPGRVIGYDVSIVPPLQGHRSSGAFALDDFARLIGRSTPTSGPSTALIWADGQVSILPNPPGHRNAVATSISPNSGVIVGYALSEQNSIEQATAWRLKGTITTLSNLPEMLGGIAMAADDSAWPSTRIVGRNSAFGPDHAVLWLNEHVIDIGGVSSSANDINKAGDIIGTWRNELGAYRPVMWRGFERIDLGGQPLNASGDAYAVNNFGEVVGQIVGFGPFLWRNGERLALPAPSECWTLPHAINDDGLIVGEYSTDSQCRAGYEHALLWRPDGPGHLATDLNELITRYQAIELTQAWDINRGGQIAAVGKVADGTRRGMLLTPYHAQLAPPTPGTAGRRNTIVVSDLAPDQVVALVWGMGGGATPISRSCPGAPVLIQAPRLIGSARADGQGRAVFSLMVPAPARGRTVLFQALVVQDCEVSHFIEHTFE